MASRNPALIIVGAVFLSLALFVSLFTVFMILGSYRDLEEYDAAQRMKQVQEAVSSRVSDLHGNAGDWAFWDDTYRFMAGEKPDYAAVNMQDNSFAELDINLMLFVDENGGLFYGKAYDLALSQERTVPIDILESIGAESPLIDYPPGDELGASGLVMTDEGGLLFAARPILTSLQEGPSRGTLVLGRFLDGLLLNRITAETGYPLDLRAADDPDLPQGFAQAAESLSPASPVRVAPLDGDRAAAYWLITDAVGEPCLVMRMDIPRSIYHQGLRSIAYFLAVFLVLILVSGTSVMWLIQRLSSSRRRRLESERRYLAVVEQAREGILFVDPESVAVLDSNRAVREMLGYSEPELASLTLFDIGPGWPVEARVQEVLRGGEAWSGEMRLLRKGGGEVDVELSVKPISYDGRQVLSIVVRDIAERKRAEGELRESEERHRDTAQQLRDFLSVASHELRHPITIIRGYAEILSRDMDTLSPRDRSRILESIDQSVDRLGLLLDELLDISRMESGTMWLRRRKVDVRDALLKVVDEMKVRGAENSFAITMPEDMEAIAADPDMLARVLVILLDNAVKFSSPDHPVEIVVERGDRETMFSVMDRGGGVPRGAEERIFERFHQVEDVLHHSIPGLGLGLFIAREIVNVQDGNIWYEHRPGGGSVFRFTIPHPPGSG